MNDSADQRSGALPRFGSGLPQERRRLGLLLAALGLPALTAGLVLLRGYLSLGNVLLIYLLAVVGLSVAGGVASGILAALASFLLANFFLTPPYHTLNVERRDSVIALLVFLAVGVTVSALVDMSARRQASAARSRAEAAVLGRIAAEPFAERSPEDVLNEVATTFGLPSVSLVENVGRSEIVLAQVGTPPSGRDFIRVPAGGNRTLLGDGASFFAADRHLLSRLAAAASAAVDAQRVARVADRAAELAEVDRLRSALLAAVGHDLRTPLASIKAAATTLRSASTSLQAAEGEELLTTIIDSADRLADLLANLLDLSRLESNAVRVDLQPVPLDEVVARVLIDRQLSDVRNEVADDLPMARTDAGLLERVVANLVDNAQRHASSDGPVELSAHATSTALELHVVDHGPGVDESDRERIFLPFQRLDDHSTNTGVGLGLAIARGFTEALGGTLTAGHTDGGGLTMTLTLPRATLDRP